MDSFACGCTAVKEGDEAPELNEIHFDYYDGNPIGFGDRDNVYYLQNGIIELAWTKSGTEHGMDFYPLSSGGYSMELIDSVSVAGRHTQTVNEFHSIMEGYWGEGYSEYGGVVAKENLLLCSVLTGCVNDSGRILPQSTESKSLIMESEIQSGYSDIRKGEKNL